MSLINYPITPIPDTAPAAIPSLWNERYEEIDENFDDLDTRTTTVEEQISGALGGAESLSDVISESVVSAENLSFFFAIAM